jgi:hypothetical protein
MRLFPRHRVVLTDEDSLPQRFAHSLPGMAIITGVLVQAFHGVTVRLGAAHSTLLFIVGVVGQLALLLGFATLHLGSHPVHQWRWRAPIFALVESVTAMAMIGLLIALRAESIGTQRAHWHDWLTLAQSVFFWHMFVLLVFALVLGLTVQWVRFAMLRHEHRDSTAMMIHADHVKQEQE